MKLFSGIIFGVVGAIGAILMLFFPAFAIAFPMIIALQMLQIPLFIGKAKDGKR